MRHFGIIGKPLLQSFSANHFNKKFKDEHIDAEYTLYPLERIEDFPTLVESVRQRYPEDGGFCGMNVTIPYKSAVIPYLTKLDSSAAEIGAVNVIRFEPDGTTIGYNSDAYGFIEAIRPNLLPDDKKALILGTGGAAKACFYGLKQLGVSPTYVSRNPAAGQLSYNDLRLAGYQVIVNCTPLGMYPDVNKKAPIPYEQLTSAHFLFDCIYNPKQTLFLREGAEHGCRTQGGIGMLLGQAKAAWEIWGGPLPASPV